MALKVTYTHPDFPKDQEFEIIGLGMVTNGKTVTLTEEQERSFLVFNQETVKEALGDSESIKVEGTAELKGSAAIIDVPTNEEGGEN